MKTKTIPFDLETAKDIQDGKIEGKIKKRTGEEVRIICWDRKSEHRKPIVALIDYVQYEVCWMFSVEGKFNSNSQYDLVLEVPDNETIFNVGDTVSINIINSFYDADFRARYHSKLAKVIFTNKYGAGVKTIISGDENYFTFDELTFVRRDFE